MSKPVARDATTLTYTDTGSVWETLPGLLTLGEKPTAEQRLDWLPARWLLRMRALPQAVKASYSGSRGGSAATNRPPLPTSILISTSTGGEPKGPRVGSGTMKSCE